MPGGLAGKAAGRPAGGEDEPDVLVIGAGIAGLCCAHFLRQAGYSVTVADRAAVGDPSACSSGNTGFLGAGAGPLDGTLLGGMRSAMRPDDRLALPPTLDPDRLRWFWHCRRAGRDGSVRLRSATAIQALKQRSQQLMDELAGLGYTASGMVHAYRTAEAFALALATLPRLVAAGIPLRKLSADELRELEPDAEFTIAGALHNPVAGFFATPDFTLALARLLVERGVRIRQHSPVDGFRMSGGAIAEVRTGSDTIRPREVVIAAGAWSGQLTRLLGLRVPVQPVRGHSITVQGPENAPRRPVLLVEGTVAMRPHGDRLRFGGDLTLIGLDAGMSRRRIARLLATVHDHLPTLRWTGQPEVWTGFRPCTPDSLPMLGRVPGYANLTIATGHGHSGMGLAPASGELIAQLLSDRQPLIDPTPFRPDRFLPARRRSS
ncbi:MAG: NAD(P)/FAD-dependent oxidoreductase [Jatrophihabitantaceae bacterium]